MVRRRGSIFKNDDRSMQIIDLWLEALGLTLKII